MRDSEFEILKKKIRLNQAMFDFKDMPTANEMCIGIYIHMYINYFMDVFKFTPTYIH